jgi:hypothetical protein
MAVVRVEAAQMSEDCPAEQQTQSAADLAVHTPAEEEPAARILAEVEAPAAQLAEAVSMMAPQEPQAPI